jgi:hypothetical protein
VLVAERYADGLTNKQGLDFARDAAWSLPIVRDPDLFITATGPSRVYYATITPAHAALPHAYDAARNAARYAHQALSLPDERVYPDLLRDIFGNPFRPLTFSPVWKTSAALSLAATIYDERTFDHLPILADALEDAGCNDAAILSHCRRPGPHARGCWVVDVVLGKS